jgi:purine nucleosidase
VNTPGNKRKLIIDTDTAADDSFALLVGLLHPLADLQAVTIVAGNVEFSQQVENALITIDQAGRGGGVPVFPGARRPLLREWVEANAHGDGKGNHDWPPPTQKAETQHAAEAIVELATQHPGEIDIIAIGPLTNVALALGLDPDLPQKIREIWIMGGCDNSVGNISAAAEYNFFVDPEAAQMVMAAGFHTTIVTWTLTLEQATWGGDKLEQIAALGTPLSHFFTVLNQPNRDFNKTVGVAGSTHPDSVTAMLLLEPSLIQSSSDCYVEIETGSELTRGYSLMDRRLDRAGVVAPNARVIESIDAEGFFSAFTALLSQTA